VGVVCQRLEFLAEYQLRVPRCEVLMASSAAKGTIRAGQFSQLATVIQSGAEHGMWSFDRYQRWIAQKKDWERPSVATTTSEDRAPAVVPAALQPIAKPKPQPKDASLEISIDEEEVDLAELAKKIEAKTR
jgi:hypothetical protein